MEESSTRGRGLQDQKAKRKAGRDRLCCLPCAVLSLHAVLPHQEPAGHRAAGSGYRLACSWGIGGKSSRCTWQQHGGNWGTWQALKWSPWCWRCHRHGEHHRAFGNGLGPTDLLHGEQLVNIRQQTQTEHMACSLGRFESSVCMWAVVVSQVLYVKAFKFHIPFSASGYNCLHFVNVHIYTREEFVNSPNSIYLLFTAQIGVCCIIITTKPLLFRCLQFWQIHTGWNFACLDSVHRQSFWKLKVKRIQRSLNCVCFNDIYSPQNTACCCLSL